MFVSAWRRFKVVLELDGEDRETGRELYRLIGRLESAGLFLVYSRLKWISFCLALPFVIYVGWPDLKDILVGLLAVAILFVPLAFYFHWLAKWKHNKTMASLHNLLAENVYAKSILRKLAAADRYSASVLHRVEEEKH